jgi:hypothetical protein
MPGMTNQVSPAEPAAPVEASPAPAAPEPATVVATSKPASRVPSAPASSPRRRRGSADEGAVSEGRRSEHVRAQDYAATRLVNFRIPVDLHDRFKRILRDVEDEHPRLRKPNLTELLIGLLEEGPQTADGVAAVIRRKRAAEHSEEDA